MKGKWEGVKRKTIKQMLPPSKVKGSECRECHPEKEPAEISFQEEKFRVWRDSSVDKITFCSYRDAGSILSTHGHSQLSVNLVPRDLKSFSDF